MLYSIGEAALANNLKPFEYVKFLLETLPASTTADVSRLLPWSADLPDCCKMANKQEDATHAKN